MQPRSWLSSRATTSSPDRSPWGTRRPRPCRGTPLRRRWRPRPPARSRRPRPPDRRPRGAAEPRDRRSSCHRPGRSAPRTLAGPLRGGEVAPSLGHPRQRQDGRLLGTPTAGWSSGRQCSPPDAGAPRSKDGRTGMVGDATRDVAVASGISSAGQQRWQRHGTLERSPPCGDIWVFGAAVPANCSTTRAGHRDQQGRRCVRRSASATSCGATSGRTGGCMQRAAPVRTGGGPCARSEASAPAGSRWCWQEEGSWRSCLQG